MPNRNLKTKNITVSKHKFRLEIYNRLVDWEIFPHNYSAALYAFSNKNRLNKIIEKKIRTRGKKMIKDELEIKAFYKGKEVKIIELHHLSFFHSGLLTLANKWKVKPFDVLVKDLRDETTLAALNIMIGLIYKDMCTKSGYEVNLKKFKNEMLLKNKKPKVFLMESDYLKIPDNHFDNGIRFLKKIGFIKTGYHHSYIQINNSIMDYCRKLGNYLFDTWYCQESFKRNTHYFGDHNSYDHFKASQERKQISNKTLN